MSVETENVWQDYLEAKTKTAGIRDLEELRIRFLGKKGSVTQLLKSLGGLSNDEKPVAGAKINELKKKIHEDLATAIDGAEKEETARKIKADRPDYSLPGTVTRPGALHPLQRIADEVSSIFVSMGFFMAEGPEIEEEYYNFEALNVPKHHPARDMQDTFYLEDGRVLRTQTSPVQIRVMETIKPPFKMIALGKVYRRDSDITHSPMFHQMEGLVVGDRITMSHLKGTLVMFAETLFGKRPHRFRPSYFPFTEPSAEMDIQCIFCEGKGCKVCKFSGWMEILGCGMVNPKVFEAVNYDPEKWTGFAFGMGIERITMLRYGIGDIRNLFGSHYRFLNQF